MTEDTKQQDAATAAPQMIQGVPPLIVNAGYLDNLEKRMWEEYEQNERNWLTFKTQNEAARRMVQLARLGMAFSETSGQEVN